jgi:hypothetical protein
MSSERVSGGFLPTQRKKIQGLLAAFANIPVFPLCSLCSSVPSVYSVVKKPNQSVMIECESSVSFSVVKN